MSFKITVRYLCIAWQIGVRNNYNAGVTPLGKKQLLKDGERVLVLNPPASYLEALGAEGRADVAAAGQYRFVQIFVESKAELERQLPTTIGAVAPDGLLWIAYKKGGKTDINRDNLWQLMEGHGWNGVTLVSVDDTWSSMRFRPAGK